MSAVPKPKMVFPGPFKVGVAITDPEPFRFTREQYYQMGDQGMFEGRRVELLFGAIYEMAPQKDGHAAAVRLVDYALRQIFRDGYTISVQLPMRAADLSEPEPDVAVLAGAPRDNVTHPRTALLIVEVSDVTLVFDRTLKAACYAQSRVADYWIVNLLDRCLEVHREPVQEANGTWRYGDVRRFAADATVCPWAAATSIIKVADLLP